MDVNKRPMLLLLCLRQSFRSSWLHSCSPQWEINVQGQVDNSCPGAGAPHPNSTWMFVANSLSPTSLFEGHVAFHTVQTGLNEFCCMFGKPSCSAFTAWKIKWSVVTWLCTDCRAMSPHKDGCHKFNISITDCCRMDKWTWYLSIKDLSYLQGSQCPALFLISLLSVILWE